MVSLDAGRVRIAPADYKEPAPAPKPGAHVSIAVRLQRPNVDPGRCIGCGICEHECPVQGVRAIRVTAENESRAPEHALITRGM
jgi:ferredoxin